MANQVISGAQLACSFGTTPATLTILPVNKVNVANRPAANIMDHVPTANIPTFGMCTTPANPQVASATAAAMGTLTPQPCVPVTPSPWVTGAPTVLIGNQPALDNVAKCTCAWTGVISIAFAGQATTSIP